MVVLSAPVSVTTVPTTTAVAASSKPPEDVQTSPNAEVTGASTAQESRAPVSAFKRATAQANAASSASGMIFQFGTQAVALAPLVPLSFEQYLAERVGLLLGREALNLPDPGLVSVASWDVMTPILASPVQSSDLLSRDSSWNGADLYRELAMARSRHALGEATPAPSSNRQTAASVSVGAADAFDISSSEQPG